MRLCLVEDQGVSDLGPIALTRPAFELLLGSETLGQKIAAAFRAGESPARRGVVVRAHLADLERARRPETAVNDGEWLSQGPVVVANARWVPPADFVPPTSRSPWVGICEDLPACVSLGPRRVAEIDPNGVDGWMDEAAATLPAFDVGGRWIRRPWDLIALNAEHLIRDFDAKVRDVPSDRLMSSFALIGPPERLSVHESVRIEPYTTLVTTQGPITIDAGVQIQSFTRIEGPCHIGPGTRLFCASIRGGVTLGPECRIGGEVEASIVHGYSNKYHEGFLGHAYVGEWINLGAITSNSDLRNDYGEVHVPVAGNPVATGQAKVGCFIGDYSRAAMGCMLNTGTVVGVMCNLLPFGELLPKHIPSFTELRHGHLVPLPSLERQLESVRVAMGRRDRQLLPQEAQMLADLYEQTRLERERALQRDGLRTGERRPVVLASALESSHG